MAKKYIYDIKEKKIIEQEIDEIKVVFTADSKILDLKEKLSNTDYQAIKYAEGHLTEEEYAPIKEQRQAWRNEINQIETSLVEIKYKKDESDELVVKEVEIEINNESESEPSEV